MQVFFGNWYGLPAQYTRTLWHESTSGTQGLCGMRAILAYRDFVVWEQFWYTRSIYGMRTVL
eukprot:2961275-Amphidinium_carterae.1